MPLPHKNKKFTIKWFKIPELQEGCDQTMNNEGVLAQLN